MAKQFGLIISILLLLTGCATTAQQKGGTDTIDQLLKIKSVTASGRATNPALTQIRLNALKDTAMSLGARSGLAWRSQQIDAILKTKEQNLGLTYNFYGLMLPHNMMPPVLVEAQNTLNLAGPDSIRLERKIYQIVLQAHFVTTAPTWRDYIWMLFPKPEIPNNTLLPKNSIEQKVWNEYVTMGWKNGIQQANNIFAANLARLNRDYNGMVLYRKLYAQNMVSAPFVAKTNLGITGNASQMSINDQVLRITALPQLNLKGNTWKPVIVPDELSQSEQRAQLQVKKLVKIKTKYVAVPMLSK